MCLIMIRRCCKLYSSIKLDDELLDCVIKYAMKKRIFSSVLLLCPGFFSMGGERVGTDNSNSNNDDGHMQNGLALMATSK